MNRTAPEWNLFRSGVTVSASSFQAGFEPCNAANEDIRTWWAAEEGDTEPRYEMDLGEVKDVYGIQINFAEHEMKLPEGWDDGAPYKHEIVVQPQRTEYTLEGSADGGAWEILRQGAGDYTHDFICFDAPRKLRFLRVVNVKLAMDGAAAISGLRVFGKGRGNAPDAVGGVKVKLLDSGMDAKISWDAVKSADGYNIRYGTAPDKLYNCWQLWGETELLLPFLNKGTDCYVAVDSFNENGVTAGSAVKV
jgi:hypothetical protein